MNSRVKPSSYRFQHRYELNFMISNASETGARQAVNNQGRFVSRPYDNSDLHLACGTLEGTAPTDPLHESQVDRLRRFVGRADKLLDRRMAQPDFTFPSLKMSQGTFNTDEIRSQIGEEWDAVVMRLRPFINQDLFGENMINIVVAGWRRHPEIEAIKKTIRRYYLLEDAARHRDLFTYRRNGLVIVASLFKDGTFEASGERGSFLQSNYFSGSPDQDTPEDRQRLLDFIDDPTAGTFQGGVPFLYGLCRVMNDKFFDEWLQKIEYHDIPKETEFFTAYMDVDLVEWFIRYQLAYGLRDRIAVFSWLAELARKLV